jgi:hypothetical protein
LFRDVSPRRRASAPRISFIDFCSRCFPWHGANVCGVSVSEFCSAMLFTGRSVRFWHFDSRYLLSALNCELSPFLTPNAQLRPCLFVFVSRVLFFAFRFSLSAVRCKL